MHPKACFALFALGLALAQAVPASRVERKSVVDEATLNLKAEELGADKDRAKKSTICMDVKDKGSQMAQVGPVQTLNLMPQSQMVPQMTAQVVPQMAAQMVPQMQAYSVPSSQQPVQTVSVIHTQSQPAPAPQTVVIPQPVQPIHTLQIIQPPQPCPQQPNVNIVQPPAPEVKNVEIEVEPEPTPAPAPQTTTQAPVKYQKPERIVMPYGQYMDVSMVPVAPVCKEQLMVVPQATMVKVPHCPHSHQGLVASCNCRTNALALEPVHTMALRHRLMGGHALLPRQANLPEEKKDAKA